eukprot:s478_g17.t1
MAHPRLPATNADCRLTEEFLPYTPATAMRFLLAGQLRYVRTIDTGDLDPVTDEAQMQESIIDPGQRDRAGQRYPVCHKMLKNYANDFVMWVSNLSPEEMTDVLEPIIVTMLMKSVNRAKTEKPGGLQPQLHVIANAMARTAASTRPIRLLLRSNLDGFEVTASDGVASVLRAQMVLGKPAVQAHVQSSPALFSLDADLRSLELDLSNSQGAWEPCLEPFSGMLQVERTNDGNNCTQQFRLIGRSPLLVNITPSMVHRTAWLWDAFSRATDVPAAGGRRPSNGGTAGFRVINICEFPMELGGQNIQGDVTSRLMVQPTGSLWEQLDDWVLPNFVTAVRVRLPQGDWSQELSLDCAGIRPSDQLIRLAATVFGSQQNMEFEVRSFVSSVLEDAVDCFADDAEEAVAIDFFADDFQDEDTCQVEVLPSRDEVSTTSARHPEQNHMLQYLCRLLDGALSGEARVFEKPPAPDALLLAGKRFARSRVAQLCPRKEVEKQVLLPLDCLPLSPPVALRGPSVAMLLGGPKAFTPYVFSVPRPPSMPRVKPRRNVRPFITSKVPLTLTNQEAESSPRVSNASTSAMALDLGLPHEQSQEIGGASQKQRDRAYKEKLEIETKVLKVLKVSPEEVRQNLVKAKKSDIEVHRQALEQTQDEESVMQMFATKCLSTIYAWMLSSFFYEMIKRFLAAVDPAFDEEDAAKDRGMAGGLAHVSNKYPPTSLRSTEGLLAWSIVPILQYKIREIDDPKSKYSRLHAAVDLQAS